MITRKKIVSFWFFILLKYDRTFGAWYLSDKIKSMTQHFATGGSEPGFAPKIYFSFLFCNTFK